MPSNELVPTGNRELAVLDDESPCPLWDAELHAILTDVEAMARDHELFPLERQAFAATYETKLRRLTERVEAGEWLEELPKLEPDMYQEVETRALGPKRALWALTDSEIAAKFNKLAEHLALMDAEHQAGLRESAEHQEALKEIWGEQ